MLTTILLDNEPLVVSTFIPKNAKQSTITDRILGTEIVGRLEPATCQLQIACLGSVATKEKFEAWKDKEVDLFALYDGKVYDFRGGRLSSMTVAGVFEFVFAEDHNYTKLLKEMKDAEEAMEKARDALSKAADDFAAKKREVYQRGAY